MKKFIVVIAALVAASGLSFAQDKFSYGISIGGVSPFYSGPDKDAKKEDGYKIAFGYGGSVGFDFYIPIYKGIFIKPAIYGEYTRTGDKLSESSTKESTRMNTSTFKHYDVTIYSATEEKNISQKWNINVPVVIGYTFRHSMDLSYSVGAVGYATFGIKNKSIVEESSTKRVSPDKYGESEHSSDRDETDLYDLDGIKFKDRLDYGIGGQAGLKWKRYFLHYTFLYSLKDNESNSDPEKSNRYFSHNFHIGIYF